MKKLKIVLQYSYLYLIILVFSIIFSLTITLIPKYKSKYREDTTSFNCIVNEYKIDGNKLEINLKCKEKIIGNYYFKTKDEKINFLKTIKIGDKVNITGTLKEPKNNTVPYLFNYKKYLYNQKIYYTLNIQAIEKTNNKKNIFYKLKSLAYKKTEKIKNNEYIYAYILGKTYKIDDNIINSYRTNGISHLFALSGLHVGVFSIILLKILKKLKIGELLGYTLVFLFLILFSFITGFSPSILRASLLFFLMGINKILKLNIKTINILYLTFSILVLINPFIIYNLSFVLSFTSTYFIIISADYINDKSYIKGLLKVSTLSFISNIGLSIYYFNYINPLGIIMNLIFVPLVSFIIFPLTIVTYFLPIMSIILNYLTNIMELLSLNLSKFAFKIYFPQINLISLLLYYIILILIIKYRKTKCIILIIIVITIWKIKPLLNANTTIYFLDVGQGDSSLIVTPHNKTAILIDTGGITSYKTEKWMERSKEYSIATDTLIPFMHKIGIKKIDYLFLTHGDYDHMGEAANFINDFKVDKVVFNCGSYNNLEKELIKLLEIKNIEYYSCINELNINKNRLSFLNTKEYNNENDNSSVIYTELSNVEFLFMADASSATEKEILNKYKLSNIDIIKVGHHGSKTSSSKEFINTINPKYGIISVGENNRYGHPNKEVLETLSSSKIFRTDQNGSVIFKIKNNKLEIKTCSP